MKSKRLDYINIWLLVLSFVIAIYLPFELFLFSYAVLGPLHYLTEINWLDDKKYFIKSKSKIYKAFIVLAIIISVYPFVKYLEIVNTGIFNSIIDFLSSQKRIILLSGFIFSVSLVYLTKIKHLLIAFVFSVLFSVVCNFFVPKLVLVMGVFLPTLIHVYIFTLLFMIYGQLKKKSNPGIISVLLLVIAPFIIMFLNVEPASYVISDFSKNTYSGSGFLSLNETVARFFGDVTKDGFNMLSPIGLKVQIFIAFAYTYHYLNWFSKTSVIGWKASLTSTRMKYVLVLWLCAVGLYLYDYVTGLTALFFLSLLHVVLEFPLNVITIKELLLAVKKKFGKQH